MTAISYLRLLNMASFTESPSKDIPPRIVSNQPARNGNIIYIYIYKSRNSGTEWFSMVSWIHSNTGRLTTCSYTVVYHLKRRCNQEQVILSCCFFFPWFIVRTDLPSKCQHSGRPHIVDKPLLVIK